MLASALKQRDTADCETPASCATSYDVGRGADDERLRSGRSLAVRRREFADLFKPAPLATAFSIRQ